MATVKGKRPHVLAIAFPAQGHVSPLIKLSRQISRLGVKVTFVTTQNIYSKIIGSWDEEDNIGLASIPDGLSPEDDPNETFKLLESLKKTMPDSLTDVIEKINNSNSDDPISCIIADVTIGWILEILAEKMGAEAVLFAPASAASFTMILQIPNFIKQGNIDVNGTVTNTEIISLSDNLPAWRRDEVSWSFPVDLKTQKLFFECAEDAAKVVNKTEWLLCNTFYDLESTACDLNPKLLPIGPLHISTKDHSKSCSSNDSGSFLPQDDSCISWLNNKPNASVIYVSFGSIAVFSQYQLDELALGLELSGRPFLWIVRWNLANGSRAEYPDGFLERIDKGIGKIVEWAPQEKVLNHPSIVCFLSHCGWNSTMEGLSNGVPFLCWPYFADQYHNQNYICDQWKIGLRICADETGIRSRHEISSKIEMLISDDNLRNNALKLKELAVKSVSEEGSSSKNLENFIDHLKKLR